jgi:cysteine desulfurase
VLRALGVDEAMAHTSIRFGIDRRAIELTVREMSPLYEMMKEGSDINGHNTDWLIH